MAYESRIVFRKEGHDVFIDYLKGVCILWVVMTHAINPVIHDYTLFCLWGDMAVPVFLLIQCVHVYKRDETQKSLNWNKIWLRIIRPFLILQLLIFMLGLTVQYLRQKLLTDFVVDFLTQGGKGSGSYYVKMYLEFAILIPLLYPLFKKNSLVGGAFLILLSAISEIVFSYWDCFILWQWLCLRYLILIYLGFVIARNGIDMNLKTILLSLFSIVAILWFQYSDIKLSPFFYDNPWKRYHWPIYFYVAFMLLFMLHRLHSFLPKKINSILAVMGKYSYEIFLLQMLVFYVTDMSIRGFALRYGYIVYGCYMLIVIMASVFPVLWYKQRINSKIHE